MTRPITPNMERVLRRHLREAREGMTRAAVEFLDARAALRAARRAYDAAPVLDFRIGYTLCGRNVGAANRAWKDRPGARLERELNAAIERADAALGLVHETRAWYRQRRAAVRAIDSGEQPVEVGAAWSPRGLENVRGANRGR